jgi:hypothetical protein
MTISFLFPKHESFEILNKYMFSTERKQYIDNLTCCPSSTNETENPPLPVNVIVPVFENSDWKNKIQSRTVHAKHIQDSLFGSIYLAHHGFDAFKRVCNVFGKTDNEEKQKIISYLQTQNSKQMNELVNYNLTKVLYDKILQDLSTCPETPYHCVIGLCLYYKCSIYIVDTVLNTYITFINDTCPVFVLFKNPNAVRKKMSIPSYFVDTTENCVSVVEIEEKCFKLFHYNKPLQSITSYKLSELEIIAQKLNISYEKKMKKKELYEKIYSQCGWT